MIGIALIFGIAWGSVTTDFFANRTLTKEVRDDFCGRLYSQHYDYTQCIKHGGSYLNIKQPNL